MSIAKLAGTLNLRRLGDFVSHVLGPKLIADTGEWGTYAWAMLVLGTPGGRIAGGSDEVMRNIVGERVLGLPKDPGIDSKSPFRDLKVGTATELTWRMIIGCPRSAPPCAGRARWPNDRHHVVPAPRRAVREMHRVCTPTRARRARPAPPPGHGRRQVRPRR